LFSLLSIVKSGAEKMIKIWSPFTGELIRNLNGHTQGLSDIAWSADSVYLASASDDTTIRIWEVDSVRSTRLLAALGRTLVLADTIDLRRV
jgi:COMPASS component SWD3